MRVVAGWLEELANREIEENSVEEPPRNPYSISPVGLFRTLPRLDTWTDLYTSWHLSESHQFDHTVHRHETRLRLRATQQYTPCCALGLYTPDGMIE